MLVALAVLVVMRKHMVGVGGGAWAAGARRWTRVFAVGIWLALVVGLGPQVHVGGRECLR